MSWCSIRSKRYWLQRWRTDDNNEDSQGAFEISKNARFHNRTKHIDVQFHFIREKVSTNEVKVVYISTEDILADIMTKGLTKKRFQRLRLVC